MLTERFPELHGLDAEEKLILAGELWREATRPDGAAETAELPGASGCNSRFQKRGGA